MDYSHYLHTSIPLKEKLLEYGFEKKDEYFFIKKNISGEGFYAFIEISDKKINVSVFDSETDEKYALFDVVTANGSFVGRLRNEVEKIMDNIHKTCFECKDVKEKFVNYLLETFECKQDFPWDGSPDYIVFRCKNEKWFGLIMNIPFKCLGFQSEEKVWVVNLKTDSEKIEELVDRKSIFPAYHMNKKYWITVLLTSVTDFDLLCELTKRSYSLVEKKK